MCYTWYICCIWKPDQVLGVLGPPEQFPGKKIIASYCAIMLKTEKKSFFPPCAEKWRPDLDSGGQVYMKNTPLVPGGFDKGQGSK